jgi:hypothetical protein
VTQKLCCIIVQARLLKRSRKYLFNDTYCQAGNPCAIVEFKEIMRNVIAVISRKEFRTFLTIFSPDIRHIGEVEEEDT